MKAVKEFLKPNWWKGLIWIVIVVFIFVLFAGGFIRIKCKYANEFLIGSVVSSFAPPCEPEFNPIIFPFLNSLQNWESLEILVIIYYLFLLFYYYLFACLIYLIIAKIKRLITKPK